MDTYQFWTIIGMLAAGFGWMIHRISEVEKRVGSLDTRIAVIETILSMMRADMHLKGSCALKDEYKDKKAE